MLEADGHCECTESLRLFPALAYMWTHSFVWQNTAACASITLSLTRLVMYVFCCVRCYPRWIKGIRRKFPWYRIAIFYVFARKEQVLERARVRGEETGRFVPSDTLLQSIQKTAEAVERLGPLADFVARIDNSCLESPDPVLMVFEDRSHSFRAITDRFRNRHETATRFPDSLGTVRLRKTGVGSDLVVVPDQTSTPNAPNSAGMTVVSGGCTNPLWHIDNEPWTKLLSDQNRLHSIRVTDLFPVVVFGDSASPLGYVRGHVAAS